MSNSEALSFSDDGLSNRSLFMSDLNDINIFVEDKGKEYQYEEIFERLYEGTLNIFCIFPLGGKRAVLDSHKEKGIRDPDGKLNVFIVDGDFDNLWDDTKEESPNLIYLSRYNIESYLISKEACIQYLRPFLGEVRKRIESLLRFEEWKEQQKKDAGDLFILFAIAEHYCPSIPSVSTANKFLDDNGNVRIDKYTQFRKKLEESIPELDNAVIDVKRRISDRFEGDEDEKIFSIICGKYLYLSLYKYLHTVDNRNVDYHALKNILIPYFDTSKLYFLRKRIDQLRT